MITIADIITSLPAHLVSAGSHAKDIQITNIIAGDLMSDILVSVDTGCLLVTGLASEQAVRTADIVCAEAVLLVNDKLPSAGMKKLAEESGMTLLATPLPMFDACVALGNILSYS
ncbi:hypothetical protein [Treponema brennaborense]|uniref:DRTGG domain-containing protein n=1 Tax=Treponema brennaborense (strain DSM 12168 / CIP 105900 / DD5/3) TaxID=906968 RepID=F4LN38_TREBD|nr:hypothetical protein [Treponema brennaborense]AEE15824.1 hypothetical protein Trebr_0377 [Treponema brennaborense DSM 12168]